MKRLMLIGIIIAAFGCGGDASTPARPPLSKYPVSVRGWIADVDGANRGAVQTAETEGARLTQLFQATTLWIENAAYVSGGVAETGAFILLDVPPGDVTVSFNAPGAETAGVALQNIPGNADVFIPAVLLKNGGATLLQPEGVVVRVPGRVDKPRLTGKNAIVAGVSVPIIEAPLSTFANRREYPERGIRPLAVVR